MIFNLKNLPDSKKANLKKHYNVYYVSMKLSGFIPMSLHDWLSSYKDLPYILMSMANN